MGNMVVKNDVVIVKDNAETLVKKLFDSEPCMANSNKKSMDVAVEQHKDINNLASQEYMNHKLEQLVYQNQGK